MDVLIRFNVFSSDFQEIMEKINFGSQTHQIEQKSDEKGKK